MTLTNTEHNNADQQQLLPMGPNKPIKKVRFDMNHSIQEIPARDENDHGQMFRLYYDQADYDFFRSAYERQMARFVKAMPPREPRRMVPMSTPTLKNKSALAA
jgi:hypothetical protein